MGVLLDACLHPQGLTDADLITLRGFGVTSALAVADGSGRATEAAIAAHWSDLATRQLARLEAAGIAPSLALGVHPRALPPRGRARLLEALPLHLRTGRVRAIGLIGLAEGGQEEELSLREQLELAATWQLPVVASARAAASDAVLRRLFALLAQGPLPRARILVEGLSPGTVGTALALGFHAGLTLLPGRCPAEAAVVLETIVYQSSEEHFFLQPNRNSLQKGNKSLWCKPIVSFKKAFEF